MSDGVEDFLEHYGVKGMKWGQRKLAERHANGKGVNVSPDGKVRRNTTAQTQAIQKSNAATKAIETRVADKKMFSKKEVKLANQVGKEEYDLKKTNEAYAEAKEKGEQIMVKTRTPGDYADTVMTGKQFVEYAESGAALNVASTRVFARQAKEGEEFVLNNFEDEVYVPIVRK
ncbi:hypothetical protein HWC49_gp18 [Gordonia phage Kenosha]|uniref:Uncharacterized protein n=1 Tax=Gordonia phage Kenosha TaxID=2588490 RepID=A0A514CXM2_9CAUD|nr:hypothetical protein HWC49_gp18 [Gordonia phage Kenosha]QDH85249.1 hypothetical protein SEA_KENOSHA_18 [Gordonia phage Kenosha]WIC89911.1 hypothetical protein SEA_HYDRUS_20 [Gordonia phage Hydrus]